MVPVTDNSQMICSICIANYNGSEVIRRCLDAVMQQDTNIPFEILVHDDCSTDDSVEIIENEYPDVILLKSTQNVGYCRSNNILAASAKGEYILFLNNDAFLQPNVLSCLHDFASQNESTLLGLPQIRDDNQQIVDYGHDLDLFMNPIPITTANRHEAAMQVGACLWIPRKIWMDIEGFPEWFYMNAEDMYVCLAARMRGHPTVILPESGFRHVIGHTFSGGKSIGKRLVTSTKRRHLSERNKLFNIGIFFPAWISIPILLIQVFLLFLEASILAVANANPDVFKEIFWKTMREFVANYTNILTCRRKHMNARTMPWRRFLSVFHVTNHKIALLLRYGIPRISG